MYVFLTYSDGFGNTQIEGMCQNISLCVETEFNVNREVNVNIVIARSCLTEGILAVSLGERSDPACLGIEPDPHPEQGYRAASVSCA
jgi:hypothetical protein